MADTLFSNSKDQIREIAKKHNLDTLKIEDFLIPNNVIEKELSIIVAGKNVNITSYRSQHSNKLGFHAILRLVSISSPCFSAVLPRGRAFTATPCVQTGNAVLIDPFILVVDRFAITRRARTVRPTLPFPLIEGVSACLRRSFW